MRLLVGIGLPDTAWSLYQYVHGCIFLWIDPRKLYLLENEFHSGHDELETADLVAGHRPYVCACAIMGYSRGKHDNRILLL